MFQNSDMGVSLQNIMLNLAKAWPNPCHQVTVTDNWQVSEVTNIF